MPKGIRSKTRPAHNTQYLFYTCSCGWELIIDNVKDMKRAEKLRGMKIRCHMKHCENPPTKQKEVYGKMPKFNGRHLTGRDSQNLAKYTQGYDIRKLMEHQFPDVKLAK